MEPKYALRYLADFLRVLKKGGILIFQLPGEKTIPSGWPARAFEAAPKILKDFLSLLRFYTMGRKKKEELIRKYEIRGIL